MKIDVYDTYATSTKGKIIHFDVLLQSGGTKETALQYARSFLTSIGEKADALKSERCNFCHTETAHPVVEVAIAKSGHYILQMEGCPDPA
ncbi:MAG: DUF2024 family protein [Candidatus Omnitrophica bacterium]|nr:DUF2024 family protein [Candidatus Omnitrophota bacterium]